ncbi:MAG: hypothetical protein IPN34_23795 [Planctomycetes bacterium]|nr:hypothetical protein [Planctomycetota bacterium]
MTKHWNQRWAAFRIGACIGTVFVLALSSILLFSRLLELAFDCLRSCLHSMAML